MRHELHLTSRGLRVLAAAALPAAGAGFWAGGGPGAASAALGLGLVAANHALAGLSTGWARSLRPGVLAFGYAVFVVRMIAMFAALRAAAALPWVQRPLVAAAFCGGLALSLGAECLSYARGSYVPRWRMAR